MKLGDVAAAVGKGLFAGVAGTAAMTASSTLEAKLRGRGASSTPAQAAQKVLGVEPIDEGSEAQFSNLVHWGYGTVWGGARGLLAAVGPESPAAARSPRGSMGQRANNAAGVGRYTTAHRVGGGGDRHRRPPPPRVRHRHRAGLLLPR